MNLKLSKHLPPLSEDATKRLVHLASLNLQHFGEQDLRETFLAPIVEILGYERGSPRDVIREDVKGLSPSFVMLGSKKFKLDYHFVIWKQGFWLLEAKAATCADPAKPPLISDADVGQAFVYSIHPQIDAPYYAVSNGWWTSVYERDAEEQKPILTIAQKELPARFNELRGLVGAEQVTFHLKRRLLTRIEQVLGADTTLERADEFIREVQLVAGKMRPRVLENFRAARKREQTSASPLSALLANGRSHELVETALAAAISMKDIDDASDALADKVIAAPNSGDTYLFFSKLLHEHARPSFLHEYINSLAVLAALAQKAPAQLVTLPSTVLPENSAQQLPLRDIFSRWTAVVLDHFVTRPDLRFLWAAEAVLGRVSKRLLLYNYALRNGLAKQTDLRRYLLPEEVLAAVSISEAGSLIAAVTTAQCTGLAVLIAKVFDRQRQFRPALAKQEYNNLIAAERKLKTDSPDYAALSSELGREWSELLFFDSVNVTFDKLGAGACDILKSYPDLLKTLPAPCHDSIEALGSLGIMQATACCGIIGRTPVQLPADAVKARLEKIFDPF